jgi:hypothetical protein
VAQGLVNYTNENVAARVDEVKVAYAHLRRLMDALIQIRNGTDYQAVAEATGCTPANATTGQTIFDNLDAALGGMTTAQNALSNMDKNSL